MQIDHVLAIAVVGFFSAIIVMIVFEPDKNAPHIACIQARGEWKDGTCNFKCVVPSDGGAG